ncbi:Mariner Mos1 transposase [Eumeta japonica]|uniref:Mariner Mos1 transposase n=1 Tax=Eumeta variegata TaxID=151549 RepID=A0A4C1WPS3_EUMVA|nr:Mariner Mos1 transposase [Eumeta japonica]
MDKTAAESHRILLEIYDEHALAEQTCRKWFARFKSGDFELDDKERPGQPKKFVDEELQGLLDKVMGKARSAINISGEAEHSWIQASAPYLQRHDKVILLHDNARPHVAKPVKRTWERCNGTFYLTCRSLQTLPFRLPPIPIYGTWPD